VLAELASWSSDINKMNGGALKFKETKQMVEINDRRFASDSLGPRKPEKFDRLAPGPII
jgi:hypothetical protein